MNPTNLATKMLRDGYIVIPGVDGSTLRQKLEGVFLTAPEFKDHPTFAEVNATRRYVCGGTSFVGTPSIFHSPVTRRWHIETAAMLMPFITELAHQSGIPMDEVMAAIVLHDRIQVRPAGESAAAESFHLDSPGMRNADDVKEMCFGGFQNCDPSPQYFCGIKGSHRTPQSDHAGFTKIGKEGQKHYTALLAAQATHDDTDKKGKIIVPPGHLLLFLNTVRGFNAGDSGMVHAVNSTKVKYTSVKLFFGFRLTTATNTGMVGQKKHRLTYEQLDHIMATNDLVPLGSGQTSALWPGLYHCFPDTMVPRARHFVETMLVDGALRYPFEKANSASEYTRSMKSLADMGLPLHEPYRQDELDLLRPQKIVRLRNFETGEIDEYPLSKRARS